MPDTGWIRDDDEVERITEAIGGDCLVAGAAHAGERLEGYADRQIARGNHGVFPHLAELALFGDFLPAWNQKGPICVSCGTAQAIEASNNYAISEAAVYGKPVRVSVAAIYGGSRNDRRCGNGRLGNSGGSIGAWAAYWIHDRGVNAAEKVGSYNLADRSVDNALALKWGAKGKSVPESVVDAGAAITVDCYRCKTADDVKDCAWAGYGMTLCHDYTFGPKDKSGVSRLNEPASHCTVLRGGAVMPKGTIVIGGRQSWGNRQPAGTNVLTFRDGAVKMAPAMTFVPLGDIEDALGNGAECWAFQVTQGWR